MKKLFSLFRNPLGRNRNDSKQSVAQNPLDSTPEMALESPKIVQGKVLDAIAMTIQGLPAAFEPEDTRSLSASIAAVIMTNAAKKTYHKGDTVVEGEAMVDFRNHSYPITFVLQATQLLAAIEAYKQGYDQVKIGEDLGLYDRELAEVTAAHFKSSAWHEVEKFVNEFDATKMNLRVTQIKLEDGRGL
jgi:hypothetical protein